jgi:hypothetical protein
MRLQEISEGMDADCKLRFISRTQRLLDDGATETHNFLDASLIFQEGDAIWKQDLAIIDTDKPQSPTNPLMNPEIPVKSASHAYDLFREYYLNAWLSKKNVYTRSIGDLEEYCDN